MICGKRTCLFFVSLSLLSASCRTAKVNTTEKKIAVKDSTYTKFETVDTMLIVRPADMVSLSEKLDRLTEEPRRTKKGAATLSLSRIGDDITAICECDELKAAVEVQKETITMLRETVSEQKQTIEKGGRTDWLSVLKWIAITVGIWKVGDIVLQLVKNRSNNS